MPETSELQKGVYQIKVYGRVNENWSEWFNGLALSLEQIGDDQVTTLTGRVADQAALRGILNALWDLNLTLISVMRFDTSKAKK